MDIFRIKDLNYIGLQFSRILMPVPSALLMVNLAHNKSVQEESVKSETPKNNNVIYTGRFPGNNAHQTPKLTR